jgi:hypothetical protein
MPTSTTLTARTPLRASAARAVGLALLAVCLGALHLPWRPPTLCLLRATTGIPCPLCGVTTATTELGSGAPVRAFAASPLAVLGTVAIVLGPVTASRWRPGRRTVWTVVLTVGVLSEAWQLHRFGWL